MSHINLITGRADNWLGSNKESGKDEADVRLPIVCFVAGLPALMVGIVVAVDRDIYGPEKPTNGSSEL